MKYCFLILVFCIAAISAKADSQMENSALLLKKAQQAFAEKNCETGLRYLRAYQNLKPDHGAAYFAELYLRGYCLGINPQKAAQIILPLAEKGFKPIYAVAGYLLFHGIGIPKDTEKANYWFRGYAAGLLGGDLKTSLGLTEVFLIAAGLEKSDALSDEIKRFHRLESGDPKEQVELAQRLLNGNGIPKDPKLARRWLEWTAFQRKHVPAMYELARWYRDGIGGEKDDNGRYSMLITASMAGHIPAMVDLAHFFADPAGTSYSLYNAHKWLIRAQDKGADVMREIAQVRSNLSDAEIAASIRSARRKY